MNDDYMNEKKQRPHNISGVYSVLRFIYCKAPGDSWKYIHSPSGGTL